MDPITILGAVGTTLKIVKEVCEGLQWMQRVWENVTHGDKILQQIALECNIYGDSIKTIGQWLKKNKEATGLKRQMRTTQNAITLVEVSMANLLLDLKRFQETGDKTASKEKKMAKDKFNLKTFQQFITAMAKQQWFRETMKIHLVELRAHTATLHLTLDVIRLVEHTPEKNADTSEKSREKKEETLQEETVKLERKLLMRQILTKALEIKRAEIADLAKRDDSEASPSTPSNTTSSPGGSIQDLPRKLTFYDVVQLARQQALAKKTEISNENTSISLTEAPQAAEPNPGTPATKVPDDDQEKHKFSTQMGINPTSSPDASHDVPEISKPDGEGEIGTSQAVSPDPETTHSKERSDVDLLDLTSPTFSVQPSSLDLQELDDPDVSIKPPSLGIIGHADPQASHMKAPGTDLIELMDNQVLEEPSGLNILGLVQPETRKRSIVDLLGLDDPQATQDLSGVKILNPMDLQATQANGNRGGKLSHIQPSTAIPKQETRANEASITLEPVQLESSQTDEPVTKLTEVAPSAASNLLVLSTNESSEGQIHQSYDTYTAFSDSGSTATATPSIFSQSSTLNSADSSVPGFSEAELQARKFLSTNVKSPSCDIPFSGPDSSLSLKEKALSPSRPSLSKSVSQENDAEAFKSFSTTSIPTIYEDSALQPKTRRSMSDDSISQSSTMPELSNIDEPDEQGYPWIVFAARTGNEDLMKKLLIRGADIAASHATTGRHALSEASLQGHQEVVNLLIEEKCPLDQPDAEGYTALHHACHKGHLSIAKSLVTSGAQIDALGPQAQTALHLAMQVPHQNVIMLLVQHNAKVNSRDASSQTPLHIGASQGNITMCNFLLNEGAQLDSRDAQSKTPLQIACEAGHYELTQVMLKHSNLNATNMTFLTAFFAAVEHGHVRIAESFFQLGLNLQDLKKATYKPITLAAKSGALDMVELMIQENCDINASDEKGWNALHFASYFGHYQIIDRLVEENVSSEAHTLKKETPLLFAVKGSHFAVTESLLRSNKDGNLVSEEDERGEQLVHHVARTGEVDIFNLSMSCGAKFSGENAFGWQPLHIATAYGHLALVQRLLEQGANIEEKTSSPSVKKDQTHRLVEEGYWAEARWPYPGSCPLHLACEYGHDEIAQLLISKGAKLDAACSEGWQPLHHATYIGSSRLVEMLLGAGANPHGKTNEGKTALTLPFCPSGSPISEDDKELIRSQLSDAMERVKKTRQKNFKVTLKKGSTVEDKHNLVRAATFSIDMMSRTPAQETKTTRSPKISSTSSQASSLRRPQMPHLPHTSPLPQMRSPAISSSNSRAPAPSTTSPALVSIPNDSSTLLIPESQMEMCSPDSSTAGGLRLEKTDSRTSDVLIDGSTTDKTLANGNQSIEAGAHLSKIELHTCESKTNDSATDQNPDDIIKGPQRTDLHKSKAQVADKITDQAPEVRQTPQNSNSHTSEGKIADTTTNQPSKESNKDTPSHTPASINDSQLSVQTRPKAKRMMTLGLKKAKLGIDALRTETLGSEVLTAVDDGIKEVHDFQDPNIPPKNNSDAKTPSLATSTENQISTETVAKKEKRKTTLGLSKLKSGIDTLQKTETLASEIVTIIDDGVQDVQDQSILPKDDSEVNTANTVPDTEKKISTQPATKKEKRRTTLGLNKLKSGIDTLQRTETLASEVLTIVSDGISDQSSLVKSITENTVSSLTPNTKQHALTQPTNKKDKRKTTLGLGRMNAGIDKGMVGLGTIGKQTLEIGNKTLEISNKGLELGKHGLDLGMQGLEIGKQGLDMVQGLEMGNISLGNMGLKGVRKFATKGSKKKGISKGKSRSIEGGSDIVGGLVAGELDSIGNKDDDENNKDDDDNENDDEEEYEDDDDDDNADTFSLGGFGEFGNDDF